jgi:hypothetical protein
MIVGALEIRRSTAHVSMVYVAAALEKFYHFIRIRCLCDFIKRTAAGKLLATTRASLHGGCRREQCDASCSECCKAMVTVFELH